MYADFEWARGRTPLSHPAWPVGGAVAYLLTIVALKRLVIKPVPVPTALVAAHNLLLSAGSLVMLIGCCYELIQICTQRGSADFLFCTPKGTLPRGGLWAWSYVYYLSKYYEFFDTVLLVLKQKPTSALHVFHHAFVVLMSWLWVDQVQSLQFAGLLANTAVHVLMYYYFFLTACKVSPWWKKYITLVQIVQFVSSFCFLPAFFWYQFYARRPEGCAGLAALAYNGVFNLALLVLFVQFYLQTYKKRSDKRSKDA